MRSELQSHDMAAISTKQVTLNIIQPQFGPDPETYFRKTEELL